MKIEKWPLYVESFVLSDLWDYTNFQNAKQALYITRCVQGGKIHPTKG